MKSLIVILTGLYISWRFTDLESESLLLSGLAPFGVFVFLVAFCMWLVLKAGFGARTSSGDGAGGTFSEGGDGSN